MNSPSKLSYLLRFGLNEVKDNNYIAIKELGSSIPFVVHQSYPLKKLPVEIQNNIDKLKLTNPNWEFKLYDDIDIEQYIEINYPNLIKFIIKLTQNMVQLE